MRKKNNQSFFLKIFALLIIILNLVLGAWDVLHGELNFNTDIARDFLLLENVIQTHKLALIGPRSGGINGLFHGPLWLYINLPVYILSKGNPVGVGWFWIFLTALATIIVYIVGKSIFDHKVGLFSAILFSAYSISNAASYENPFGAVLLSPIFFYFFYKYLIKNEVKYLLFSLLTLGCIIQFQVAFGGPILILISLYLLYFTILKTKKYLHFLSYLILIIPFSTYILFELRHNFLQTHSVIANFTTSVNSHHMNLKSLIENRLEMFISVVNIFTTDSLIIFFILLLVIVLTIFKIRKLPIRKAYYLFYFLFLGYIPLSFFLNGNVQSYHISPFIPILILIFSSGYLYINKIFFTAVFILIFMLSFASGYKSTVLALNTDKQMSISSWKFNHQAAQRIFNDAGANFGYYIYTPDELGYSNRYALDYVQRGNKYKAGSFTKEKLTYLLISPNLSNSTAGNWWKINRVKISTAPNKVISYKNGFRIEKYILDSKQIMIPSDPNLINGLIFR